MWAGPGMNLERSPSSPIFSLLMEIQPLLHQPQLQSEGYSLPGHSYAALSAFPLGNLASVKFTKLTLCWSLVGTDERSPFLKALGDH